MARARKKSAFTDLASQADRRAPIDSAAFLAEARPVLAKLTDDLLARADASPAVTRALETRHAAEQAAQRTAESFVTWRRSFVDQVAAAWLLSCVFVRTLEDRGLVRQARLAGPGAADSQRLFLELAPSLTERDYMLTTFRELCHVPAARELFDAKHNPVWLLAPSAEAAKALLQLFRAPHADAPAFRFGQADTRFLGDLYQDLNDDVKKRYALLQTPRFIESFILDRTLERAIERFGLDDTTLIDPTCGSGHFLLGAFERLVDHRLCGEPGLDVREAARRALDQVFGADINPYAVAIARFRLTLAFLGKAGYATLTEAPPLPLHLVVADSLLHNPQLIQLELGDQPKATVAAWKGEEFALEDEAPARDLLHRRYAVVVGNPPYITVKDPVLRKRYRDMYKRSAAGKYSVAAPFTERFFQLGREGAAVGMITANSFMKREFGKKLIEEYLPTVNLDLVINTSGAFIPGHATPTVLLFGTSEGARGSEVHVVLASRGEPSTPENPVQGLVWRSIADHWSEVGFENDYVTVMRFERATLSQHPWSLGGGGASELKELLEERADKRLCDLATTGVFGMTNADECMLMTEQQWSRTPVEAEFLRPIAIGEEIRDWSWTTNLRALYPYEWPARLVELERAPGLAKYLWPFRTTVGNRATFGGGTYFRDGLPWWKWHQVTADRVEGPAITFAFVATHNHFVLDRGGKVFKQSAPIIKLPESATENDHYALLSYLNSSTACFWLKQVAQVKQMTAHDSVRITELAQVPREFSGANVEALPLPKTFEAHREELAQRGRRLSALGEQYSEMSPDRCVPRTGMTAADLARICSDVSAKREAIRREMIALQEELDWFVYRIFGLAAVSSPLELPPMAPGSRTFELLQYARSATQTTIDGFEIPSTEHAPSTSVALMQTVESSGELRALEQPDFKRRWVGNQGKFNRLAMSFGDSFAAAVASRLALRLEDCLTEPEVAGPRVLHEHLADAGGLLEYLASIQHPTRQIAALLRSEAVPYLAAWRYTEVGLEKHLRWEGTWSLQRREDAGEKLGDIPVPPKYDQKDFRDASYWPLRGKLDVPKERFISYPGCESDEDGEPVYGWAGWDHAQRARALGTLYYKRKTEEGWKKDRLTPMLAGLLELLPWLHQWHAEPDEEYGGQSPAKYFQDFLDGQCTERGLTHDDLKSWRPPEKRKAGRKKQAKSEEKEDE